MLMASLSQLEILLPELRAYARSICGSMDDAEDLVQDAIERSLRAENVPGKLQDFRPWMFRIIHNLNIDELRKRRVRKDYSKSEENLHQGTSHRNAAVQSTYLRMAYDKLPPDMREILFLVDIMGMKYKEASQVINVPDGTVMSRVSRARRALAELVNGPVSTDVEAANVRKV